MMASDYLVLGFALFLVYGIAYSVWVFVQTYRGRKLLEQKWKELLENAEQLGKDKNKNDIRLSWKD